MAVDGEMWKSVGERTRAARELPCVYDSETPFHSADGEFWSSLGAGKSIPTDSGSRPASC
jgi:hypothetical protein